MAYVCVLGRGGGRLLRERSIAPCLHVESLIVRYAVEETIDGGIGGCRESLSTLPAPEGGGRDICLELIG